MQLIFPQVPVEQSAICVSYIQRFFEEAPLPEAFTRRLRFRFNARQSAGESVIVVRMSPMQEQDIDLFNRIAALVQADQAQNDAPNTFWLDNWFARLATTLSQEPIILITGPNTAGRIDVFFYNDVADVPADVLQSHPLHKLFLVERSVPTQLNLE